MVAIPTFAFNSVVSMQNQKIEQLTKCAEEVRLEALWELLLPVAREEGSASIVKKAAALQARWMAARRYYNLGQLSEKQWMEEELAIARAVREEILDQWTDGASRPGRSGGIPWWSFTVLLLPLAVVLLVPCPTSAQYRFFLWVFAAGLAAFSANVPAFFQLRLPGIRMGGAFVVFLALVYADPLENTALARCEGPFYFTGIVCSDKGLTERPLQDEGRLVAVLPTGEKEAAIGKNGEAVFAGIERKLEGASARFLVHHREPYALVYPDSVYTLTPGQVIYVAVKMEGWEKLWGNVTDEAGQALEGAKVSVDFDLVAYTDESGNFFLSIPENRRKKSQHLSIYKKGYALFEQAEVHMSTSSSVEVALKPLKK